VSKAYMRLLSN